MKNIMRVIVSLLIGHGIMAWLWWCSGAEFVRGEIAVCCAIVALGFSATVYATFHRKD